MPAIYQNEPVTILRPVTPAELGANKILPDHVLIRKRDGTEHVVEAAQVTDTDWPADEKDMGESVLGLTPPAPKAKKAKK